MKLTPDQVLTICKGDQEIAAFVQTLLDTIEKQAVRIEQLENRVHESERQLGSNSNNSCNPPSSDGLRKPPVNLHKPGGKTGAPKGHPGHTLHQAENPEHLDPSSSEGQLRALLRFFASCSNRQLWRTFPRSQTGDFAVSSGCPSSL